MAAFLRPCAERGEALPEVAPLIEFWARAQAVTPRAYANADDAHEAEQADDVARRATPLPQPSARPRWISGARSSPTVTRC